MCFLHLTHLLKPNTMTVSLFISPEPSTTIFWNRWSVDVSLAASPESITTANMLPMHCLQHSVWQDPGYLSWCFRVYFRIVAWLTRTAGSVCLSFCKPLLSDSYLPFNCTFPRYLWTFFYVAKRLTPCLCYIFLTHRMCIPFVHLSLTCNEQGNEGPPIVSGYNKQSIRPQHNLHRANLTNERLE